MPPKPKETSKERGKRIREEKIRLELAEARGKEKGVEVFAERKDGRLQIGGAEERRAVELEAIRKGEKELIEEGRVKGEVRLEEAEGRRAAFAEETGSAKLAEELKGKIAEPPSLAPEKQILGMTSEEKAQQDLFFENVLKGRFKSISKEDLQREAKNAAIGIGIVGGALAAPVALSSATTAIKGAILGGKGSIPGLAAATAGIGAFVVGPGIFDFRGDEMDNLRTALQKVVEDGERIEAAARNGLPTGDTINILTQMDEEISFAESRLKEIGNNNVQYRVSKEFRLDMARVRSAREAILRRVLAVENIAATGQAAVDPAALLFDAAQF